ncbi:MAG: MBL fold metallo-hydrolase [Candidatus Sericytochromatia bacterium]|nr:MBL fold metallo-hydrolase [Candidatus Sericytochromatia bacterium]
MIVETLAVGAFRCNCTIIGDETSGHALVVDPGDEADLLLNRLRALELEPVALFHTHAHLDHYMATRRLKETFPDARVVLHEADLPLWEATQVQARIFGFRTDDPCPVDLHPDHGTRLTAGALQATILHTPGHTPGSCCLHLPTAELLCAGDTLFRRGIGRTDLWGGSARTLASSIRTHLYELPGETRVIAGHGLSTTIDEERTQNPFVSSHP